MSLLQAEGGTMAFVVGRPGYGALREALRELDGARTAIEDALSPNHLYEESELSRLCESISKPLSWVRGAEGECRTAASLLSLPDTYVVYHDFHLRRRDGTRATWNIDHIVLGPTGLFVIDSKNHRVDTVESAATCATTSRNVMQVLRQVFDVRDWVVSQLPDDSTRVFVRGVLVYARPDTRIEKLSEKEVWVLPLDNLNKRIQAGRRRLSAGEIATVRRALSARRAPAPAEG